MNTIRCFLCTIVLVALISGCQSVTQEPQTNPQITTLMVSETGTNEQDVTSLIPVPDSELMKGYELYSWQKDSQLYFSILIGTNREKALEEIQSPKATLKGIMQLKSVLEVIPSGQYVTWLSRESLAFPSDEIIGQVEQICQKQGLMLTIAR